MEQEKLPERPVIVIPGDEPGQFAGSRHVARLERCGKVRLYKGRPRDDAEKLQWARDAEILLNSNGGIAWPGELLRKLLRLKYITARGVGVDSIDLPAARELGILVSNVPAKTAPVVAEHAVALMLGVARNMAHHMRQLQQGVWEHTVDIYLRGKTLGIAGTGAIGGWTAKLGRALGMRVLAWTFHPTPERAEELGVKYVAWEELLARSDVLSLHVKLTDATRGLLGTNEIQQMKPGALLINTARGALVDMPALVEALESGHLGGAGLDVFDVEPLPADHPILSCDRVLLTPHNADQTPEGLDFVNGGAVDNILAFLEGKPQNLVT